MTGEEEPLVRLLREKLGDDSPWERLTKKARRQYREAAEALAQAGALRADEKAGGLRRVVYACLMAPQGSHPERDLSFLYGALRRGLESHPVAICTACGPQNGIRGDCEMCGRPTETVGGELPNPWEPQPHGEWGDWALPEKHGNSPRPFVTRLPNGSISLHLEGVSRVTGYQFTREEWDALVAIADGRIKGRWER